MIIGLTGYAQSGKDTVANYLVKQHGFTRVAFADKIRDILYDMNPMVNGEPLQITVDVEGWDKAKQRPAIRLLLQNLGVSARKHLGEDFWINQALKDVGMPGEKYVITDVRFRNEATAIWSIPGGCIWRVTRPGVKAVNGHISETQMDSYPVDHAFINDGSIDDLENTIKIRMMSYL